MRSGSGTCPRGVTSYDRLMSKKRTDKHRARPQRRSPSHLRSVPSEPADDSPYSQELMQGLRRALRAEHPSDLLLAVSGLMNVADPRMGNPLSLDDEPRVTLDVLVDSFAEFDYAETTAALTVIREFTADDLLSARIGKVLQGRRQPLPGWLDRLDAVAVSRVVEMTHVLGDGDNYFLEVKLQTGEMLTATVYVDHNMGGIVKDAFVIPDAYDAVQAVFHEKIADPDSTFRDVDPADARAIITEAIDRGARTLPQPEADTWPGCRPVVEWLLRNLPEGSAGRERREWSEDELADVHDGFFASPYGQALDEPDERRLLENLTWFGSGSGPGDPLRWSPVNVEILLVNWIPRKIVADPTYLAKAPDLLRRFVEYCHDRRGISRELTRETLASVDRWEPEFQRLIRSSRPQGPEALVEAMLGAQDEAEGRRLSLLMLEHLDDAVGGRDTLMNLDTGALPDEPFAWAGIPDDIRERVQEVLDRCDRCADELLDVEHRTAFRRFLSRAAVGDPGIFRRKGSPDRAAAAVCWAVAKANETIAYTGSLLESQELIGWFGVQGSVSQRAEVFLKAIGVDPYHQYNDLALGSPDLLVSARRAAIVGARDRYLDPEL